MDSYELEGVVKNISLEDAAKVAIIRGYRVMYISRETRETHDTRYEGLIFKHPIDIPTRIVKETRIFSAGNGYERSGPDST